MKRILILYACVSIQLLVGLAYGFTHGWQTRPNTLLTNVGKVSSSRLYGVNIRKAKDFIKEKLVLSDIVSHYVDKLHTTGTHTHQCLCPFHDDQNNPSMAISDDKGLYHCFSCEAGGDIIKFVQEIESLTFPEAVVKVLEVANMGSIQELGLETDRTETGRVFTKNEMEYYRQKEQIEKSLNAAAAFYSTRLMSDPKAGNARSHLLDRSLSPATVFKFQLGYAPAAVPSSSEGRSTKGFTSLTQNLTASGYTIDELVSAGLTMKGDQKYKNKNGDNNVYDRFRERLMIPIFSPNGQVLGFGGRFLPPISNTVDGQKVEQKVDGRKIPKYLNSPETATFKKSTLLFGMNQAKRAIQTEGVCVIVEGYFDVIALHDVGIEYVVGAMGTAISPQQLDLAARSSKTGKVVLLLDADEAGQAATQRVIEQVLPQMREMAASTNNGNNKELDLSIAVLPTDPTGSARKSKSKKPKKSKSAASKDAGDFCLLYGEDSQKYVSDAISEAIGWKQWMVDRYIEQGLKKSTRRKTVALEEELEEQKGEEEEESEEGNDVDIKEAETSEGLMSPDALSRVASQITNFLATLPNGSDRTILAYYCAEKLAQGRTGLRLQLEEDLITQSNKLVKQSTSQDRVTPSMTNKATTVDTVSATPTRVYEPRLKTAPATVPGTSKVSTPATVIKAPVDTLSMRRSASNITDTAGSSSHRSSQKADPKPKATNATKITAKTTAKAKPGSGASMFEDLIASQNKALERLNRGKPQPTRTKKSTAKKAATTKTTLQPKGMEESAREVTTAPRKATRTSASNTVPTVASKKGKRGDPMEPVPTVRVDIQRSKANMEGIMAEIAAATGNAVKSTGTPASPSDQSSFVADWEETPAFLDISLDSDAADSALHGISSFGNLDNLTKAQRRKLLADKNRPVLWDGEDLLVDAEQGSSDTDVKSEQGRDGDENFIVNESFKTKKRSPTTIKSKDKKKTLPSLGNESAIRKRAINAEIELFAIFMLKPSFRTAVKTAILRIGNDAQPTGNVAVSSEQDQWFGEGASKMWSWLLANEGCKHENLLDRAHEEDELKGTTMSETILFRLCKEKYNLLMSEESDEDSDRASHEDLHRGRSSSLHCSTITLVAKILNSRIKSRVLKRDELQTDFAVSSAKQLLSESHLKQQQIQMLRQVAGFVGSKKRGRPVRSTSKKTDKDVSVETTETPATKTVEPIDAKGVDISTTLNKECDEKTQEGLEGAVVDEDAESSLEREVDMSAYIGDNIMRDIQRQRTRMLELFESESRLREELLKDDSMMDYAYENALSDEEMQRLASNTNSADQDLDVLSSEFLSTSATASANMDVSASIDIDDLFDFGFSAGDVNVLGEGEVSPEEAELARMQNLYDPLLPKKMNDVFNDVASSGSSSSSSSSSGGGGGGGEDRRISSSGIAGVTFGIEFDDTSQVRWKKGGYRETK